MALIVSLRGINVGGHRRLRPSALIRSLAVYEVVNIGAAGTLVVRKPGRRAEFLAELRRNLPFEAEIASCDSDALLQLEREDPFRNVAIDADTVRFVSVLSKAGRKKPLLPISLPTEDAWLVRVMGSRGRIVFGAYRRQMRTIGCLGQIDQLFGAPAATRSWSTVLLALPMLTS